MSKEPGPREKALRVMREANYAKRFIDMAPLPKRTQAALKKAIDEAAKKTGKPRKKK